MFLMFILTLHPRVLKAIMTMKRYFEKHKTKRLILFFYSIKGFYTVYREVFKKIAEEDKRDYEEDIEIPEFGTSTSDYDTVRKHIGHIH